jgi:carbon monoxide dehydrogenase subunit G
MLHDPETIRQALPGCEQVDQFTASDYAVAMHIQQGPFKGKYHGTVTLSNVDWNEGYDLLFKGQGPEGSIWGTGTLTLVEKDELTTVQYEGDVEIVGHTASQSPRLLETTTKSLMRQFFEAVDRELCIQMGVRTTNGIEPHSRRAATVDMQDWIAEVKQDRQTAIIVLVSFTLLLLMSMGGLLSAVLLIRWGIRIFDRVAASNIHERQIK